MQLRVFVLVTAAALSIAAAPTQAQGVHPANPRQPGSEPASLVDLRPRFERGQETRFTLEMTNSTRELSGPGTPPTSVPTPLRPNSPRPTQRPSPKSKPGAADPDATGSRVTMGLKLRVIEVVPEQGATVDLVIESLKVSVTGPDFTADFDSKAPGKGDDMTDMLFRNIAGSSMTLKVDPEGNITGVSGGEALAVLGQISAGAGGGGGGPGGAGQLFGSIFSLRKASGKAAVGESWEHVDTLDTSLLGRFKMVTRHTLTSLRGGDATVDLRGRIEPGSEAPGQQAYTIRNSRHEGRYVWDTKAGMLRQMESTMSSELQVKLGEEDTVTRSESKLSIVRQR